VKSRNGTVAPQARNFYTGIQPVSILLYCIFQYGSMGNNSILFLIMAVILAKNEQ